MLVYHVKRKDLPHTHSRCTILPGAVTFSIISASLKKILRGQLGLVVGSFSAHLSLLPLSPNVERGANIILENCF